MNIQIFEGVLIPFLGTSLGAAMVFLLKKQIPISEPLLSPSVLY